MCVCLHTHTYVHVHVYACTCVHSCICVCIHVHTLWKCILLNIPLCTYISIHFYSVYACSLLTICGIWFLQLNQLIITLMNEFLNYSVFEWLKHGDYLQTKNLNCCLRSVGITLSVVNLEIKWKLSVKL